MRTNVVILIALTLCTLGLYARVARYDFVDFDDGEYVYENPRVLSGLTSSSISWAFTGICSSNWHPLTMLSHELDIELFGKRPGWMHWENAVLHAANSGLLFWLLLMMTGRRWASAWVAAMFAWHPLHVESVAWISERKDVLSTCFALLSLLFYVRWVGSKNVRSYWISVLTLGLGLLAKPMVVTLPFVMLLLDFWPLKRVARFRSRHARVAPVGAEGDAGLPPTRTWDPAATSPEPTRRLSVGALIREKIPMFALVTISAVVTYLAQSSSRAVAPLDRMPLGARLANVVSSYAVYLRQMIIPRNLAIFYPLSIHVTGSIPGWKIALSAATLFVISALIVLARRQRVLSVGWLWYLGTLVPVIGLVQVGGQAHADRYTYFPSIGIFVAVAGTCGWIVKRAAWTRIPIAIVACLTLIGATIVSWRQIGTWQNSMTVMQHAVDVVPNNFLAMGSLAQAYDEAGDHEKAAELYRQTLRIHPNDATALNNLAVQAVERHDDEEAEELYRSAILADPTYAPAYNNYGNLLAKKNELDRAIKFYRAGMQHDPNFAELQHNLALALASEGKLDEGKLDEAIILWRRAISIDPNAPEMHESLGNALLMSGKAQEGLAELRESLRLNPDRISALRTLAWALATHPNPLYQNATEAQKLANRAVELTGGHDAVALDALAAAEARGGLFDKAADDASKALALATEAHDERLIEQIQRRIDLYRSHQAYPSGH